jgi:hypothetical protein
LQVDPSELIRYVMARVSYRLLHVRNKLLTPHVNVCMLLASCKKPHAAFDLTPARTIGRQLVSASSRAKQRPRQLRQLRRNEHATA